MSAMCGTLAALRLALAFSVVAVAAAVDVPEEDGVLVLTEKNFEAVVKANTFVLVKFYAPWCGHCRAFAPDYAAAARQLKQAQPPVPLAKVDATAEYKLAEEYGVRGYPTIRLFIDGRDQEYTGGNTEQSMVPWVLKKVGPPAVPLDSPAAAEAFEKENRLAVVGLFDASTSRTAFETAAKNLEDVMFAYSIDPKVSGRYHLKPPALKMFFPHDEQTITYEGDMQDAKAMAEFVKAYRYPLITPFDGESAAEIFGDGRSVLFLFRDRDEKGNEAEKELRKVAESFNRRVLVSIAGSSEPMDQRLMDYVSVEPEELPTVRMVVSPKQGMVKYRLEGGEVTEAAIANFVKEFEAGQLQPHMKSEAPPMSQPGPVFTLVGSTFESTVKDPSKDVLVEFYAPWCGHCKKFEPVFRDVAKKLETVATIVTAKIDATTNDVAGVDVEGFPTIKLWRADNKDEPLDYDGDRDVESVLEWLSEKATFPFSRHELRNEL